MVLSNFLDNILHDGMQSIDTDVIDNLVIIQDMQLSPDHQSRYISPTEIKIADNYSLKFQGQHNLLCKNGVPYPNNTALASAVQDVKDAWNSTNNGLGTGISKNYGLYMGLDRGFQLYKKPVFELDGNSSKSDNMDLLDRGSPIQLDIPGLSRSPASDSSS